MDDLFLGDQVRRGKSAIAIALGAHLLDGLDVVVLIRPEVHHGLVVGRRGIGLVLLLRGRRSHTEEEARTVLREADRALVADDELLAEARGGGGGDLGSGAAAVPM